MNSTHVYNLTIEWTGNTGTGTKDYRAYERSHIIQAESKPEIKASSDPAFRGDKHRYNPEELLVASLSSCHMLWYLHLCAEASVIVTGYTDQATGWMVETENGGGHFKEVRLNPVVTVLERSMKERAQQLHKKAGELCFIARSVNFKVFHNPACIAEND